MRFLLYQELTILLTITDLLTELVRREKEAGINPDAEVDLFMKVNTEKI